jgi:hypothetical protein
VVTVLVLPAKSVGFMMKFTLTRANDSRCTERHRRDGSWNSCTAVAASLAVARPESPWLLLSTIFLECCSDVAKERYASKVPALEAGETRTRGSQYLFRSVFATCPSRPDEARPPLHQHVGQNLVEN